MAKAMALGGSIRGMERQIRILRNTLLSYEDARQQQAREVIEAFLRAYPAVRTLGIFDDVRDWINKRPNPAGRIHTLVAAAQRVVDDHPDDFTAMWVLAICLKYARKYDRSNTAYRQAVSLATATADKQDVRSDWGELYVYIAKPEEAKARMEAAGQTLRWHPWGYAFALHQYAFQQDQDDDATDTQWYEASNAALESWPDSPNFVDAQLIVAANWGGIARRRGTEGDSNSPEVRKARTALAAFMNANPRWSIRKEKRGPFIKGLPLTDDPQHGNPANTLRKYRRRIAKHYFQNLKVGRRPGQNDIPDTAPDDGDDLPDSDPET